MAGRRTRLALVSIAAGVILGVLSLALPSFDALWNLLGVARDLRTGQSTALAILFLSLGFLLALYFQQEDFRIEILKAQQSEIAQLAASMPTVRVVSHQTGDEAMTTLTAVITNAHIALNTRISSPKVTPAALHGIASPWDDALRRAVAAGLTYREVVSPNHVDLARDRHASMRGNRPGTYEAVVMRQVPSAFLNFIVLEYRDETKEVWFGWMSSRTLGFEGTVIRTAEQRVVTLFERWHHELFSAGQRIK